MLVFLILKLALSFGLPIIDDFNDENGGSIDSYDNASILIEKNTNIGDCACDTSDQCEIYCCCDPDCPDNLTLEWKGKDKCLSEYSNIKTSEYKALRKCNDPQIEGDGSLLDWIQRTMLCIYKDNFLENDKDNAKHGKYYEIKAKDSDEYIEDQSSLVNSFKIKNETGDPPFPSTFNLLNLHEINSQNLFNDALRSYCNFVENGANSTDKDCSQIVYNESNYTEPSQCDDGYIEDDGKCKNPNNDLENYELNRCELPGYTYNGSVCVSFYNICVYKYVTQEFQSLESLNYLENIYDEELKCNNIDAQFLKIEPFKNLESGNYSRKVTISNITCTRSGDCTANFYATNFTNTNESNSGQSYLLEEGDKDINVTLYVSFLWERNEEAENIPRGYFFTEQILDEHKNPITLDAPSRGNSCSSQSEDGGIPLKFGMNTEFTCMLNQKIDECYINSAANFSSGVCNLSNLSIIPNITSFLQVPFSYDNETANFSNLDLTGNYNEIFEHEIFQQYADEEIDSKENQVYLTGISRSIDIFYKTVGYEHSPTHIIVGMNASYDYSTSIKYLNTTFVSDYQNVALRTIIRYFEYPNNLNMFRGSSANTKLQSWLPFDV